MKSPAKGSREATVGNAVKMKCGKWNSKTGSEKK